MSPVTVTKSKKRPVDKGSTIAIPPMEIHCTYEEDFESAPEWTIKVKGGVGHWPETSRGVWLKQHFLDKPRLTGKLDEIESIERSPGGDWYVLVSSDDGDVWFNAGKVVKGAKYTITYEYAIQTRKAQYGIWGRAEVRYNDQTIQFKLMAVRAKTRSEGEKTGPQRIGTRSGPYTLVGAGLYRGRVHARQKYINDPAKHGLFGSLSIYVAKQWVDGKWEAGVKKAKGVTTNVFVHPADIPDWLDGCLALGHVNTEYGFEKHDSTTAMREVFALLGIKTREEFDAVQALPLVKQPVVLITVTDERRPADPLKLTVRLPVGPKGADVSRDVFTLRSSDGSYEKSMTVADDGKTVDEKFYLTFDGIDRRSRYSLEVRHGKNNAAYCVFINKNYAQLVGAKLE